MKFYTGVIIHYKVIGIELKNKNLMKRFSASTRRFQNIFSSPETPALVTDPTNHIFSERDFDFLPEQ